MVNVNYFSHIYVQIQVGPDEENLWTQENWSEIDQLNYGLGVSVIRFFEQKILLVGPKG